MDPQISSTPKLGLVASKFLMSPRKKSRNEKSTDPMLQVETDNDLHVKIKRRKQICLTDDLIDFNFSAVSHVAPENLEPKNRPFRFSLIKYTSTPFNKEDRLENSTNDLWFRRCINNIDLETPMKPNLFSSTFALDQIDPPTAIWNVDTISLAEGSNNDLDSTSLQKSTTVTEKSDYAEFKTPLVMTSNCPLSKRMSDETFIAGNKFFPNNTKNKTNYLSVLHESVDSFKELSTSANTNYLSVNVDDDSRRQSYITESPLNNITLLKSAKKYNSKHKSKCSVPFSMKLIQSELENNRASDVVTLKPDQKAKGLAQEPVRLGTHMMTRELEATPNNTFIVSVNDSPEDILLPVESLPINQRLQKNKINFSNISGVTEIRSSSNTGAIRKTCTVSAKNKETQDSVFKDLTNVATKTSSQKKSQILL